MAQTLDFTAFAVVSKWRDSNPRPFGPEPNALPNCATPRYEYAARPDESILTGCMRANRGTRTLDLLITSEPLYHLSHIGMH